MEQARPHDPNPKATFLPKEESSLTFPVDKTALLVIDPVNDFLSEGGAAYELTKNTLKLHNMIEHLRKTIEGARAKGIPVLFGPMAYTEDDYTDEKLQKRSGINRMMFETKMFLAGSWGADFHPDLQPQQGDIVLLPHKTCDVFRTDLPEVLQQLGTTHLVIAGMAANLCCESTARHAIEDGYDVTMIKDAMGAASLPEYEAAVHLNLPLVSNAVITAEEFLEALEASAAAVHVQEGDTVKGSDNGDIGTVEKVVKASGDTEGYILVPRGLIFKTDTFIPLDAVTKRSGKEVFINIPKLVVGEMPWKEAPTRKERMAKQGPLAGEVDKLYRSTTASVLTDRV
ncbi:cysteine hydrolase [Pontibacter diazotrophicus]|uniref:Cysteine hydrolase n=1 Tax=Pontibacter diazotrophicus TaxID=1400979 RepID=A0A3D8L5F4_9BACT|nr:isochorismatase family cysteine hydrolase [Pontibacter diazotrophicus]RDV12644.1 cysteine hydrolase [Pontibacter diazotrophicus]